jgi:hypothetical protein
MPPPGGNAILLVLEGYVLFRKNTYAGGGCGPKPLLGCRP